MYLFKVLLPLIGLVGTSVMRDVTIMPHVAKMPRKDQGYLHRGVPIC